MREIVLITMFYFEMCQEMYLKLINFKLLIIINLPLLCVFICVLLLLSQLDGFQRHFDSQIITYGKQVILNLVCFHVFAPFTLRCRSQAGNISLRSVFILQVNQKGSEKPLEQAFAKMVGSLGNGMIK